MKKKKKDLFEGSVIVAYRGGFVEARMSYSDWMRVIERMAVVPAEVETKSPTKSNKVFRKG